jgi:hypothetical protein
VNGVVNIVAALYIWGCALGNASETDLRCWETQMLDVGWMLEGLAIYYEKDWRF